MALSLAVIMILGLAFNKLFEKFKMPGLLGMLILGVILGPYGLDWLFKDFLRTEDVINLSSDFRKIALIVILLRAGFGIKKETLAKVGVPALKLSCIPGIMEGFAIMGLSMHFLKFSFAEAGMLGFIIAAVSPAVVVPSMLALVEKGKGAAKGIPTMILAGASIDDVVAITIFSTFLGMYGGGKVNLGRQLLNIPISIIMGGLIGAGMGFLLVWFFKKYHLRDTKKVLIILSIAILFNAFEEVMASFFPVASLLGVMTIGFIILEKYPELAKRLSLKFNKIWVFAEILLFVLVGAQVNIGVAFQMGLVGLVIIAGGLLARSIGVWISLLGTHLTTKERLFCVIAYTPKATVQAAIGAVPLAAGVAGGDMILAMAVMAIMITAPLGAIGIRISGEAFLEM
ncbi:MAG: cation:proton antiporter [Clostridia bacterium]|nr:cation:proton antiporter [Clostridia bacterium]